MKQEFFWTLNDVVDKNPIGPEEPAKWFFFEQGSKFGTANIAQVRNRVKEHTHDYHDEFIYVLRGEAEFTVGGVTRKVKPGDFLIVPVGVLHKATILSPYVASLSIYAPLFDKDNPDRNFTE